MKIRNSLSYSSVYASRAGRQEKKDLFNDKLNFNFMTFFVLIKVTVTFW